MSRPAKNHITITAERARTLLSYEPETGSFLWKNKSNSKSPIVVGAKAGHINSRGYGVVYLDNRQYRIHRVIWLYMTGEWPSCFIDHINGNPSDNRWSNLRDATPKVNSQNKRFAIGATRVGANKTKWQSTIKASGVQHYLGRFNTLSEATQAYLTAKRVLHEGCTL